MAWQAGFLYTKFNLARNINNWDPPKEKYKKEKEMDEWWNSQHDEMEEKKTMPRYSTEYRTLHKWYNENVQK